MDGIYIDNNDQNLNNLIISNNDAQIGGGIYINNSNTDLTNVTIEYNQADYGGGFTSNVDGYFK